MFIALRLSAMNNDDIRTDTTLTQIASHIFLAGENPFMREGCLARLDASTVLKCESNCRHSQLDTTTEPSAFSPMHRCVIDGFIAIKSDETLPCWRDIRFRRRFINL